jgi:hypothetical protein
VPTKNGINAKPEGRRGVGRLGLRWLDDVEADIKALDVKRAMKSEKKKKTYLEKWPLSLVCYSMQMQQIPLIRYGLISPVIKEGKEVRLLHHTIQKCNIQLLSRKKTSISKDRSHVFCQYDKIVDNNKNFGFCKYRF